ncbi:MAG TPA: cupredoxin domain-containing protein [Gammaproteobacteria bacterium]|jgi:plastocyanin|nr:cupredoxin domain-containing protein [Gammaproteobacteria bacterium]
MSRTALALSALLSLAAYSASADNAPVEIDIKAQAFVPAEIQVPAGVKVELHVVNTDDLPAEFESYDLSREIVVPGHGQVKVFIGPLDPGRYRFFNDFHQESEGYVVVTGDAKK